MDELRKRRLESILRDRVDNIRPAYSSQAIGKYVMLKRVLRMRYRNNEITAPALYSYYRMPLFRLTARRLRKILTTASLALTVYLACNIDLLRTGDLPSLGRNFSSFVLALGILYILKEIAVYLARLREMLLVRHLHRHLLGSDGTSFGRFIRGVIRLERRIHGRVVTREDVCNIVSYEDNLMYMLLSKHPQAFRPFSSRYLFYILRFYMRRISQASAEELRVVALLLLALSPIISVFLLLYYTVKMVEKSQGGLPVVFEGVHRPSVQYLLQRPSEFPHERKARLSRSARYLNRIFSARRRDVISSLCSTLSFSLSCLVFIVLYIVMDALMAAQPTVSSILTQDIQIAGRRLNVIHLSYLIGFVSFCLKCLSLEDKARDKNRMIARWCSIMGQEELRKHRRYFMHSVSRLFATRLGIYVNEILASFIVPFQLLAFVGELQRIKALYGNLSEDRLSELKREAFTEDITEIDFR
jgi:hypothetical protein